MSGKAAHITATSFIKPSIFEVIAQETLSRTLYPALKQFAYYLSSRRPELLGWLYSRFDENFLVFELCLQYHYLKKHSGTFAECFYNLKRVPANSSGNSLSMKQIILSLFFEVVITYLRRKLDTYYIQFQLDPRTYEHQKYLTELFRSIQLSMEGVSLVSYVTYISGLSQNHSILLKLANVTLISKPDSELSTFDWSECWRSFRDRRVSPTKFMRMALAEGLSHSVEVSAFFIQFLQWWFTEQPNQSLAAEPVPKYPVTGAEARKFAGRCPVCLGPRKTDTVLPISGYVFCYLCIVRVLKETGRCPVTKLPASIGDLVRVYT